MAVFAAGRQWRRAGTRKWWEPVCEHQYPQTCACFLHALLQMREFGVASCVQLQQLEAKAFVTNHDNSTESHDHEHSTALQSKEQQRKWRVTFVNTRLQYQHPEPSPQSVTGCARKTSIRSAGELSTNVASFETGPRGLPLRD